MKDIKRKAPKILKRKASHLQGQVTLAHSLKGSSPAPVRAIAFPKLTAQQAQVEGRKQGSLRSHTPALMPFLLPSAQLREPGPGVSPRLTETVKVQVPHLPRLTWPANRQPVSYLCHCPASMELIHWGKVQPGHRVWGSPDEAYLLRTLSEAAASVCRAAG